MNKLREIVVAFDSFKGSMTSREAGEAFARGVHAMRPDIETRVLSIADGGEGMAEAIAESVECDMVEARVHDPLGREITARYAITRNTKTAIIAMSAASGLTLLEEQVRNPLIATTYGTGELMLDAMKRGCTTIVLGLGGSATNDGGTGMLRALGYRFFDEEGNELCTTISTLERLHHIDCTMVTPLLKGVTITAAVDVDNPLCGEEGATHTFARQKGANQECIERMERAMSHYAMIVDTMLATPHSLTAGSGAAGGMGYAITALLGAPLRPGIELVLEMIGFEQAIENADMIVTGEGSIDSQTLHGKAPAGVLHAAMRNNKPTIALGGRVVMSQELLAGGFEAIYAITPEAMPTAEAMLSATAQRNMEAAAQRVIAEWEAKHE
jgi:glycerate kinase